MDPDLHEDLAVIEGCVSWVSQVEEQFAYLQASLEAVGNVSRLIEQVADERAQVLDESRSAWEESLEAFGEALGSQATELVDHVEGAISQASEEIDVTTDQLEQEISEATASLASEAEAALSEWQDSLLGRLAETVDNETEEHRGAVAESTGGLLQDCEQVVSVVDSGAAELSDAIGEVVDLLEDVKPILDLMRSLG